MGTEGKLEVLNSKNKRCSLEEKKNYYDAWKTSGLSQNKFCQKNHLPLATFSNWVRQIEEKWPTSKASFMVLSQKYYNLLKVGNNLGSVAKIWLLW